MVADKLSSSIYRTLVLYILYNVSYFFVAELFEYYGFSNTLSFNKAFLSLFILMIYNLLFKRLFQPNLYYQFLSFTYYFVFIPQIVFFQYNNNYSFTLLFIHCVFFGILLIFSEKFTPNLKFLKLIRPNSKYFGRLAFLLLLILLVPFYQTIVNFNLNNFNPFLVYLDRLDLRLVDFKLQKLMDYSIHGLTRVLLPVFSVYFYFRKRYVISTALLLIIVVLFLSTGGLKSMLIIVPAIIFFINKKYINIHKILFKIPVVLILISLLEKLFLKTNFILDIFIRRIFFVPPLLESFYLEHFQSYLFYQHSIFSGLIGPFIPVTKIIGEEYFSNPDMNANIGLITEGFLNLGLLGVILHAVLIAYLFRYLSSINIPSNYFGIFFVLFYVMNTSFIFPYLFTHGIMFLILLVPFFRTHSEKSSIIPKLNFRINKTI